MAFRKRNIVLPRTSDSPQLPNVPSTPHKIHQVLSSLGVRPSPIDGRPTTSTGTPSLDGLLAGHAGLPLGNSILIGESGTTDYAGALLRFYAAEGVLQGHKVHVVGISEAWGRELPGLAEERHGKKNEGKERVEKMKIAWRYEGLGQFGSTRGSPRAEKSVNQDEPMVQDPSVFCHNFDLAKRLALPIGTSINYIPIPRAASGTSPFSTIIHDIHKAISEAPPHTIHRLVIPSLLSPALYPPSSAQPTYVLQFIHALRALLRRSPTQLTFLITLPLSLFPRTSGLVRWIEILCDGVLEFSPFPYSHAHALAQSAGTTKDEERPQGMLVVHKLPVFHEKGGGGGAQGLGEDMAFTLSRRKFVITKFSLPPVESDTEAREQAMRDVAGGNRSAMPKKEELEF